MSQREKIIIRILFSVLGAFLGIFLIVPFLSLLGITITADSWYDDPVMIFSMGFLLGGGVGGLVGWAGTYSQSRTTTP